MLPSLILNFFTWSKHCKGVLTKDPFSWLEMILPQLGEHSKISGLNSNLSRYLFVNDLNFCEKGEQ